MKTSWGKVAGWYDELLEKQTDTYQHEVILPNLLRVLAPKKGETILDIACGQGFFSRELAKLEGGKAVKVLGCDIAPELIETARRNPDPISKNISYTVAPADNLDFCPNNSVDGAIVVLALQNIENIGGVFSECARVLKSGLQSRLIVVLNHPAFRIPKHSSWEWDTEKSKQYRRIDAYMIDIRERIDMNPGSTFDTKEFTTSFHRPLQVYSKALAKHGFAITRLEEWISHKQSKQGPRSNEEDRMRKEIPMFLMLEMKKLV